MLTKYDYPGYPCCLSVTIQAIHVNPSMSEAQSLKTWISSQQHLLGSRDS